MNLPVFKNEPFTDFNKQENKEKMLAALKRRKEKFGSHYPIIIGGKEIYHKDREIVSINPSKKDEVIGYFTKATKEDADEAIKVATEAFYKWREYPASERAAILLKAGAILRRKKFDFAAQMVYETGKNWAEADGDVAEMIDYLEFYAREMIRYSQIQKLTPYPGEIPEFWYIPLGAGLIVPPWNFPLAILGGMSSAAIVTGNTIILKPASDAPGVGFMFYELMKEAGLPDGVLNLLTGSGSEVGDYLVQHPKTRFIAFTGSREVGTRIYEQAAIVREGQIWLKRVIAEMGGKDFLIVDEGVDLKKAAMDTVTSAFGYQGQKCSAGSRLIVLEGVYDQMLDELKKAVSMLKVGPAEENFFVGPVINQKAYEKVLKYIEIGKKEGKLLVGGNPAKTKYEGFYIEPTVFYDVPSDARIAQEEIFGPVLAVIKAKDIDHAIEIANSTEYGLTGSLISNNREHIIKGKKYLHVGNLYINRKCTGALVDVQPFGGFNMSGTNSKAGGRDYLIYFLQGKSITERL